MNPNNDVWWALAKGRSEDFLRWKQQQRLLRQIQRAERSRGGKSIPATEDVDRSHGEHDEPSRAGAGRTDVLSLHLPSENWAEGHQ